MECVPTQHLESGIEGTFLNPHTDTTIRQGTLKRNFGKNRDFFKFNNIQESVAQLIATRTASCYRTVNIICSGLKILGVVNGFNDSWLQMKIENFGVERTKWFRRVMHVLPKLI